MKVLPAISWELAWIEARAKCVLSRNARGIKAIDNTGFIRGMVAYDAWTLNSVQAHMASDAAIVWRSLARPAFFYPFVECGRGLVLGIIQASNMASRKLATHLGMRETSRVLDGWAVGDDLVLHEMRRSECRWLEA